MHISYSQVESYCNELHILAKDMKETLEQIEAISDKVLDNSWSGLAATNYFDKLKLVTQNFEDVFKEIENSILYMANCAEGYQAIDENVIREICTNLQITEPNLSTSNIFNGGK